MEILILTCAIISAFFIIFFALGFFLGTIYQKSSKKAFKINNEEELKAYNSLLEWMNYGGGK